MASGMRPPPLSGNNKDSFAFVTIRDRLPDILTKVIDQFVQLASKERSAGKTMEAEDSKRIIGELSKLKNEMQTDKEMRPLLDTHIDVGIWNSFLFFMPRLVDTKEKPSWFSVAWLSCECYLYRRIFEALVTSNHHKWFDPFFAQKSKSFYSSEIPMQTLALYLTERSSSSANSVRVECLTFLEYCLWGNKCDLSISAGRQDGNQLQGVSQLKELSENILVNDTERVWIHLSSFKPGDSVEKSKSRIDFVLDNSGFELYTDLCLAEFLLTENFCEKVYFHVKSMPWFVSDVTPNDFEWTLNECSAASGSAVQSLGRRWNTRIADGTFAVVQHHYWTLPWDFAAMNSISPDLHEQLSQSQLIIFKGDLNYRKLVGDRNWPYTTSFSQGLHGFCPAPLCALRTLKADLVVGLKEGQAVKLSEVAENWMTSGNYAVIQFCSSL